MRLNLSSTAPALRLSKRLHRALQGSRKLSDCQAISAQLLGYRDWHDLAQCAGRSNDGPYDETIRPIEIRERLSRQITIFENHGLPGRIAEDLLEALRPTARNPRRHETASVGVATLIRHCEPEDLDFDELGVAPSERWMNAIRLPFPGLLFIMGATASGKSVLARAVLRETERLHGEESRAVIVDGVGRSRTEIATALDLMSEGRKVIVVEAEANRALAGQALEKHSPVILAGAFIERRRLKPGAKSGPRFGGRYDGYADPLEAQKYDLQVRWY